VSSRRQVKAWLCFHGLERSIDEIDNSKTRNYTQTDATSKGSYRKDGPSLATNGKLVLAYVDQNKIQKRNVSSFIETQGSRSAKEVNERTKAVEVLRI
jgi:hypothetical protein